MKILTTVSFAVELDDDVDLSEIMVSIEERVSESLDGLLSNLNERQKEFIENGFEYYGTSITLKQDVSRFFKEG